MSVNPSLLLFGKDIKYQDQTTKQVEEAIAPLKEEVKILNCYNQEYNLKSDTDLVIGEYIEKPQGKGDRGVATSVMITEYLNSITKQNLKPGAVGKSLKKLGFEQDEAVTRHSGSKPGRYWYIKAIKDVTIPF